MTLVAKPYPCHGCPCAKNQGGFGDEFVSMSLGDAFDVLLTKAKENNPEYLREQLQAYEQREKVLVEALKDIAKPLKNSTDWMKYRALTALAEILNRDKDK